MTSPTNYKLWADIINFITKSMIMFNKLGMFKWIMLSLGLIFGGLILLVFSILLFIWNLPNNIITGISKLFKRREDSNEPGGDD